MKLIEYDGEQLKVSDEAFLVRGIRNLFESDKSKHHEKFMQQLSYLWFMVDPRSPYQYLTNKDERSAEIKKQEGFAEDWEPSEQLQTAMNDYAALTLTTQALLLQSMRKGIDNLRAFFESVDLTAVDKNQKPIYQVSSVTTALKQVPELAKALADAEKSLAKDFAEESAVRGSVTKSIDEDDD